MPETHPTKATAVGESNNAGVCPQLPDANGDSGAEPPTLRRCYRFFQKIRIFRHNLVQISA